MKTLNRQNPLLWLGLLLLAWLVLGAQVMEPKTASGPFYAASEHRLGVTRWEAAPRLALSAWTTDFASGDTVGAKATGASLDNVASSIHAGQQGKHILGHNNFIPGRSYFNEGVDPQKLLNGTHAGELPVVGYGSRGQPIVDFGTNIGVDGSSGLATRYGTIHSGKSGAHIVPTNPSTVGVKP
ncbi:polymorphic toxin type 50 domain-containing protein [Pseudomonas sp. RA_105y_Pfl2_P56]|uniref:polymorphic toxin type 50 domain-containing protein n=1 Tax=Pseudomonas sp. RA_105y_Pfl2_P56 TaxID=3088701 RepID=UPI0030D746E0